MHNKKSLPDKIALSMAFAGGVLLLSGILRQQRRMSFRGASVVITGGSRGLGLEMARLFAREGARLTLLARDPEALARARKELIALGGYVVAHQCDIGDPDQVRQVVDLILNERGRVDVLINNASTIAVGPFENCSLQDFEAEMNVHLWGPLHLVKTIAPLMKLQGGGRIVNIGSIGGVTAVPHLVPYSAAKAALVALSDGLRAELAKDGILVTTVIPGLMRTGSHVNARFKGRHVGEYRWFSAFVGIPLFSINAERAARGIVEGCRFGEPSVILGLPAVMLRAANALLPGITASGMKVAARLLPSPAGHSGDTAKTGWESRKSLKPSVMTAAADSVIERNNEHRAKQPAGG